MQLEQLLVLHIEDLVFILQRILSHIYQCRSRTDLG